MFFVILFFLFSLIIWSPRALKHGDIILNSITEVYMSPNKCTYARGKYLLKVLVVEVQREPSSRFPVIVGCFFVLHLLVNSVIIMVIARKEVEGVFILIQIFSYLRKQG